MTAAELAEAIADLPADTLIGVLDPATGVAHHIAPGLAADQWGVCLLSAAGAITEEDVE